MPHTGHAHGGPGSPVRCAICVTSAQNRTLAARCFSHRHSAFLRSAGRIASRTARAGAAVIYGTLLTACSEPEDQPRGMIIPFDEVFDRVASFELQQTETDQIGGISAVLRWGGGYLIADPLNADLKLYSEDGRLMRTIGRAGDGPGEFRHPLRLAAAENDGFVVLDMPSGALSQFDATGAFLRRWRPEVARIGNLVLDSGGERYFFAGYARTGEEDLWTRRILHTADRSGVVVSSFGWIPPPQHHGELFYAHLHLLRVGNLVVGARSTEPSLVFHDLLTGTERLTGARTPLYRDPRWSDLPRGQDITAANEWANQQMWLSSLIALDSSYFAVGYAAADSTGPGRSYHYALVTTTGQVIASTSTTTFPLGPLGNAVGHAITYNVEDDGSVHFGVYRIRDIALEALQG
jgi:hypothetical protein